MNATKTKPKPAPSTEVVKATEQRPTWAQFEAEIREREAEIASLLPTHISRERFLNTCIIAAKNNPDLMLCDRRSLHAALTKAAEDGLQPDGREGVINTYNEKRKVGNKETWVKVACWIPMTYGIRKRARELCGMIVDAQIVCENDKFARRQGDRPAIEHEPAQLGKPRGKMIGAYAIFKQGDEILHREVMDAGQVAEVKKCVKAQNGLLWTRFEDEAWRKTVVRRGIKTVPSVPDALVRVVSRDDDQYEFDAPRERPKVLDVPDIPDGDEAAVPTPTEAEENQADLFAKPQQYLAHLDQELGAAESKEIFDSVWMAHVDDGDSRLSKADQEAAQALHDKHVKRFEK